MGTGNVANPSSGGPPAGPVLHPIRPLGHVVVGHCLWRQRGTLFVSVVAKGTYLLVPGARMLLASELEPLAATDIHHAHNPVRSIKTAREIVPRRSAVDITFVGSAHAPKPVHSLTVRLCLSRAGGALVDKSIRVVATPERGATAALPFTEVPLTYEHAFGGVGYADNPLGVGTSEGTPNLYPPAGEPRTICYAPISEYWPERKRLRGRVSRKDLQAAVIELPGDFDFAYFNAAPPDQRIERLCAGDSLRLEGLVASGAPFTTELPDLAAEVRVSGRGHETERYELVADTLAIDGERSLATITWRASVPIAGLAELAAVRFDAGLADAAPGAAAVGATQCAVPQRSSAATTEVADEDIIEADASETDITVVRNDDDADDLVSTLKRDVSRGKRSEARAAAVRGNVQPPHPTRRTPAAADRTVTRPRYPGAGGGGQESTKTLDLSESERLRLKKRTLPFVAIDAPASRPVPAPLRLGNTAVIEDEAASARGPVVPFHESHGGPSDPATLHLSEREIERAAADPTPFDRHGLAPVPLGDTLPNAASHRGPVTPFVRSPHEPPSRFAAAPPGSRAPEPPSVAPAARESAARESAARESALREEALREEALRRAEREAAARAEAQRVAAEREAEARREAEAERFRAEQAALATKEEERRAKQQATLDAKRVLYGGFGRKR